MPLQKIEFEYDIPEGYRFVRYGKLIKGCEYINAFGAVSIAECDQIMERIVVEKIPKQEQQTQEGLKLQYKTQQGDWRDVNDGYEYRIKPKTRIVRFRNYVRDDERDFVYSTQIDINEDGVIWLGNWQNVEIEENE